MVLAEGLDLACLVWFCVAGFVNPCPLHLSVQEWLYPNALQKEIPIHWGLVVVVGKNQGHYTVP
jgi:hypothetical protein